MRARAKRLQRYDLCLLDFGFFVLPSVANIEPKDNDMEMKGVHASTCMWSERVKGKCFLETR